MKFNGFISSLCVSPSRGRLCDPKGIPIFCSPATTTPLFPEGGDASDAALLLLLATLLLVAAATTADPATANTLHAERALDQRALHVLRLQVA